MPNQKAAGKLIYRLDEVSRIAKLDRQTIENWEREFYFLHAGRTASGERIFRQRDLDIILRLKDLLENQEFTLAGAKRRIEHEFKIKGSASIHSDRLKKVLLEVRDQLQDLVSALAKK